MSVYGETPTVLAGTTGINLDDWWCFYTDALAAAKIDIPTSVGTCPKSSTKGERYAKNNAYSNPDLTWLWQPLSAAPFSGFQSNEIVEVSHKADPFGDEHHGMWFVYAKGSGVYLHLGATRIFNEHVDANKYFGATGNEDMCKKAAAKNFDTVQFIKHQDAVNYPCAKGIGAPWMNMEIVAVKLVGTFSCGSAEGAPPTLRAGWKGTKPCKCDPKKPQTNCGFSSLGMEHNSVVV